MNNIVECLIERTDAMTRKPAPTIFFIGKIQYTFAPRPELTGDMDASVCIVISQEHRDYLLKDPACSGFYREYVPTEKVVGAEEAIERAEFEAFREMKKLYTPEELVKIMCGPSEETSAGDAAPVAKKKGKVPLKTGNPPPPEKGPGLDKAFD